MTDKITVDRELLQKIVESLDSRCGTNAPERTEIIPVLVELLDAPVQECGYDETTGSCTRNPCCAVAPAVEPVADKLGSEWAPCMKLPVVVHVRKQREGEAHVSTREGITPVKPDDLIMRGVSGEEYPIGKNIFEQTYTLDITAPQAQRAPANDDRAKKVARYAFVLHPLTSGNRAAEQALLGLIGCLAPQPAQEPDAFLHDDGCCQAAKTDAGRALNNRPQFAGSTKIAVYTDQSAPTQAATSKQFSVGIVCAANLLEAWINNPVFSENFNAWTDRDAFRIIADWPKHLKELADTANTQPVQEPEISDAQASLLASALGECILASGIVGKDKDGFSGPELLMFAEDLKQMLERSRQPVQEPVAVNQIRLGYGCWSDISDVELKIFVAKDGWELRTLYAAPQPRKAVKLTDSEIANIASTPCAIVGSYVHTFARAIEQAVRAKLGAVET